MPLVNSQAISWVRLGRAWSRLAPAYHIYHLTNQSVSFLARRRRPAVVTVHDLIEVLQPQRRGGFLLHAYLYGGIPHASHVIAVSQYTAHTVREYYQVPANRMTVIPNGVSQSFHLIPNFLKTVGAMVLRQQLHLPAGARVVLYVGSEHPRKNVAAAVYACARVRQRLGSLVFVKVGPPGVLAGRDALRSAIKKTKMGAAVRWVGTVDEERLNELYNLADVLLYPSRFEGFGLPPLQAMAAGLPVVTTTATSLPEVVGDDGPYGTRAALVREPDDVAGMADDVERILGDSALARRLQRAGLERAKQFSWGGAAQAEAAVLLKVAD